MQKIKMVDLEGQHEKIGREIEEAIKKVIDSTAFIKGPEVYAFQDNLASYLDVKHVIGCANGTDALQVALMSLDLNPGEEVITTPFTFVSTAETICLLGLKPVFADVDPNTFNICPEKIEKAITPKTRAVMPVHLYGQCCDMEKIMDIADKNGLIVIEDAAQALGAHYTNSNGFKSKAGVIGDIGCTSFFPTKNLGCYGDGGALFTNNSKLAEKITMLANHGMKAKYYQETVGINSRLDTIQAAILNIKLKHLDSYNLRRREAAEFYDNEFKNNKKIITPQRYEQSDHIFHQYTLKTGGADRDEMKRYLESENIPSMIYYPVPVHLQKAYKKLGFTEGDFPVAEQLSKTVISLPMHTELNQEQLSYITTKVNEYLN